MIISGRVQGVCYRAWTVTMARELGLTGWVRNLIDGTVEAVFCGNKDAVENMLTACNDGPPAADVYSVESFDYNGDEELSTFDQRPTV